MFGKRCTLCGGKIDSNGICKECGLDNKKSARNYKINQSNCDGMPMTHVHEVHEEKRKINKKRYHNTGNKNGQGCLTAIFSVVVVIMIVGIMISQSNELKNSVQNEIHDIIYGEEDYGYIEREPYLYVEEELPVDGESVIYTLESGRYVAGVHIPAGNYIADVQNSFDVVQISDDENGISLYEYEGKEEKNYLDDLWIYPGAVVEILAEDVVTLSSENAQTQDMKSEPNPLSESYVIKDSETKKVGLDIEAGVYDLELVQGTGDIEIIIYDKDGNEYTRKGIYFCESGPEGNVYKNMIFPENAEITISEDLVFTMIPSEIIESTNYLGSYMYY